jgi:hypothetical protein
MGSVIRVLAVVALAPWLALSASLAPEHVHEADSRDYHAPIVHRHLAPHDHGHSEVSYLDHDGAKVSDTDEHVIWIDDVGITEITHAFPELLLAVATHIDIVRDTLTHVAVVADQATLPHGPPGVFPSLRAPPSHSL